MEEVFVRKIHSRRPSREAIEDRDLRSVEMSGVNKATEPMLGIHELTSSLIPLAETDGSRNMSIQ